MPKRYAAACATILLITGCQTMTRSGGINAPKRGTTLAALVAALFSIVAITNVVACQSLATMDTGAAEAAASFCDIAKPIRYSRNDTAETILQIVEHNTVGVQICGW